MTSIIVHDYETTGVDIGASGIVQSAVLTANIEQCGKQWAALYADTRLRNPGHEIPEGASNVHGIYDQDVADKTRASDSLPDVYSFARKIGDMHGGGTVGILGFNSNGFDNQIAKREGFFPEGLVEYDLMVAAIRLLSRGLITRSKLEDMYRDLTGNEPVNAHDAMGDVVMCLDLIGPCMGALGHETLESFLQSLVTAEVSKDTVMPYGKHKGKRMRDVPRSYLKWLYKQDVIPDLRLSAIEVLRSP